LLEENNRNQEDWGVNMNNKDNLDNDLDFDVKLQEILASYYKEKQEYLEKYYPTDIPNDVCKHALIQGIKFENSFKPRVHDFEPIMRCDEEELFIWTHTKDKETALVSLVSSNVKSQDFWKNIGVVIQLAYSYSRDFEHTMDLEYRWFYYFNPKKSIQEQQIFNLNFESA